MINVNIIVMYIGIFLIFCCTAIVGIILLWIIYIAYDYWLKKLLSWKEVQNRKDIIYFIRHKKEIQEYIENKEVKKE